MKEPEGVNSLQEESGSRFPGASCVKLRLDQERRRWVGASALCRVHTSSCAPGPTETLHSPQGLCVSDPASHLLYLGQHISQCFTKGSNIRHTSWGQHYQYLGQFTSNF